jgi:hypothetical protein
MKHKIHIGFLFLITATLSCKVYTPQPAPIPLLTSKGELQLSGGVSLPVGMTTAIAYSPINHFAVEGYTFLAPQKSSYYQAMVGYYWKNKQNISFEVYTGYAEGAGKAMKAAGRNSLDGKFNQYYVQFNLGQNQIGESKMDYGFGVKAGITDMQLIDNGYYEPATMDPPKFYNHYYVIEPMAFLRLGMGRLRTGFQLNGTSLLNAVSKQKQIPYYPMTLGVSLNYKLRINTAVSKQY